MIEATEREWAQDSYQGQPHRSDPDMILYGGSYLRWWNGLEERVQSTADPKNASFRHMSGARQTGARTHTHTHVYIDKNTNTNGRTAPYTICQSQRGISAAPSQRWHSPKSAWLKLDLSNSAQTVSVTSESFSRDWRRSVTLVTVTASLWQVTGVCALLHIAIHSPTDTHTHTFIAEISFGFYFFLGVVNADISFELVLWGLKVGYW